MPSCAPAPDRLTGFFSHARQAGATGVDATCAADASVHAQVRPGRLEDVSRSGGAEVGLRVVADNSGASIFAADVPPCGVDWPVERVLAKAAPPGLARDSGIPAPTIPIPRMRAAARPP